MVELFTAKEALTLETIVNSFSGVDSFLLNFVKTDLTTIKQSFLKSVPNLSEIELDIEREMIFNKIPFRKWEGPVSFQFLYSVERAKKENEEVAKMKDDQLQRIDEFLKNANANYSGFLLEFISLIDGKKTTEEIISLLSLIQWRIPEVSAIFDYFEMVEHLSIIEMKEQ